MTDVSDLATEREEELREDALQAAKRARDAARSQPSAERCEQCGDSIPNERRLAVPGVRFCIQCQTVLEQSRRRGAA